MSCNRRTVWISSLVLVFLAFAVLGAKGQSSSDIPKPSKSVEPAPEIPGHTHFLDFKNGFRGVRFGTPIEQFKDLSIEQEWGAVKKYRKTDETLVLGTSNLRAVYYYFVNGKFFAVSLIADQLNAPDLLKVFQVAFGQGVQPHGSSDRFWRGNIAAAHFTGGSLGHDSEAWIGNNSLEQEYNKIMNEFIKTAAEQL